MTTNGTLLNAKRAKLLASAGLTAVNISLHHYRPENLFNIMTYLWTQSHIDNIAASIDEFHQQGVNVRLNCNLIKGHIDSKVEVARMNTFANTMHFDSIRYAELQGDCSEFVDASKCFKEICKEDNPFTEGCEVNIPNKSGIPIVVRRTCGIVNPAKAAVKNPKGRKGTTSVLFANGEAGSWDDGCHRTAGCHKPAREIIRDSIMSSVMSSNSGGCHGRGGAGGGGCH
jgi:MoaA/NifB/PqqE/SkfB family radical SAM enzyme